MVTDEDLHFVGYDLIKYYQVILTGTHPECHSTPMWDAMKSWLDTGGLWRRIGRPPNLICGVGFIAQGFDVCSYYRRAVDADNPWVAFIMQSVTDKIIGDFSLIGGGAAGLELDCITTALGSPPNMLRLASSENHSALVTLVNEEFGVVPANIGGAQNDRVRADLAFAQTPFGGALFAVSSIAWCGSLSHNGLDFGDGAGIVLQHGRAQRPPAGIQRHDRGHHAGDAGSGDGS